MGFIVVLVSVVVVYVFVGVRDVPVEPKSYVLRVYGEVWGCALIWYGGGGVVLVVVECELWWVGGGEGVVASGGLWCDGVYGGWCIWGVVAMVGCCVLVGCVFSVVVVLCFRLP
jgi:hypothetical protein